MYLQCLFPSNTACNNIKLMNHLPRTELQLNSTKHAIKHLAATGLNTLVHFSQMCAPLKASAFGVFGLICYFIVFSYMQRQPTLQNFLEMNNFYKCLFMQLVLVTFGFPYFSLVSIALWFIYFVVQIQQENKLNQLYFHRMKNHIIFLAAVTPLCLQWSLIILRYEQLIDLEWNNVMFITKVAAFMVFGLLALFSVLAFCRQEEMFYVENLSTSSDLQKTRRYRFVTPVLWTFYLNIVCLAIVPILFESLYPTMLKFINILSITEIFIYIVFQTALIKYTNPDFVATFTLSSRRSNIMQANEVHKEMMIAQLSQKQKEVSETECLLCGSQATIIHVCGSFVLCSSCYGKCKVKKAVCPKCSQHPDSFYKSHNKAEIVASMPNSILSQVMSDKQLLITLQI